MLTLYPAECYDALVSLADADAYWRRMGADDVWEACQAKEREVAIRRGSAYVLTMNVLPAYLEPVHTNVAAAVCEAAMLHIKGELYATIAASAVLSERVGDIETTYAAPANGGRPRFTVISDLLRGKTAGGLSRIDVVRA